MELTDNLNINQFKPLTSPDAMKVDLPETDAASQIVAESRKQIAQILRGEDRRRMVIVGPCSLHDLDATLDYARRLKKVQLELSQQVLIVMRAYFEKPRTTLGWKGMLYDPHLDLSYDIDFGIRQSRKILCEISEIGLPCATEFLDPIVPQYLADLISWAAIGARTIESQTHREMASGLSMPVGFKNPTDGSLQSALNAMISSRQPHVFLGIDGSGTTCIVRTSGNPDCHMVLRGGTRGANYGFPEVAAAKAALNAGPRERRILIDCGHGQTGKDHRKVPAVFGEVLAQWRNGQTAILGMMLESNLLPGKQALGDGLTYGQSITDACIDWDTTDQLLRDAAG